VRRVADGPLRAEKHDLRHKYTLKGRRDFIQIEMKNPEFSQPPPPAQNKLQ
jgi:hypothetical protein